MASTPAASKKWLARHKSTPVLADRSSSRSFTFDHGSSINSDGTTKTSSPAAESFNRDTSHHVATPDRSAFIGANDDQDSVGSSDKFFLDDWNGRFGDHSYRPQFSEDGESLSSNQMATAFACAPDVFLKPEGQKTEAGGDYALEYSEELPQMKTLEAVPEESATTEEETYHDKERQETRLHTDLLGAVKEQGTVPQEIPDPRAFDDSDVQSSVASSPTKTRPLSRTVEAKNLEVKAAHPNMDLRYLVQTNMVLAQEKGQMEQKVNTLERELQWMNEQLDASESSRNDLLGQMNATNADNKASEGLQGKLQSVLTQLEEAKAQLKAKEDEIQVLHHNYCEQAQELKSLSEAFASASYKVADGRGLQQKLDTTTSKLEDAQRDLDSKRILLQQLERTRGDLAAVEMDLSASRSAQRELSEQLEAAEKLAAISKAVQKKNDKLQKDLKKNAVKQQTLSGANEELADVRKELEESNAAVQRLKGLLSKATETIEDSKDRQAEATTNARDLETAKATMAESKDLAAKLDTAEKELEHAMKRLDKMAKQKQADDQKITHLEAEVLAAGRVNQEHSTKLRDKTHEMELKNVKIKLMTSLRELGACRGNISAQKRTIVDQQQKIDLLKNSTRDMSSKDKKIETLLQKTIEHVAKLTSLENMVKSLESQLDEETKRLQNQFLCDLELEREGVEALAIVNAALRKETSERYVKIQELTKEKEDIQEELEVANGTIKSLEGKIEELELKQTSLQYEIRTDKCQHESQARLLKCVTDELTSVKEQLRKAKEIGSNNSGIIQQLEELENEVSRLMSEKQRADALHARTLSLETEIGPLRGEKKRADELKCQLDALKAVYDDQIRKLARQKITKFVSNKTMRTSREFQSDNWTRLQLYLIPDMTLESLQNILFSLTEQLNVPVTVLPGEIERLQTLTVALAHAQDFINDTARYVKDDPLGPGLSSTIGTQIWIDDMSRIMYRLKKILYRHHSGRALKGECR